MPQEKTVRVFLRRSCGPRGGRLYGPGFADVPESFAKSLGLAPEPVATDRVGRPLPNTVAASVVGAARTSGSDASHTAIPHPERTDDDDAEIVEPDSETDPRSAFARTSDAIANAAEEGDRTGGQLIGETESHLSDEHVLTAQPGNTTDAGGNGDADAAETSGARTRRGRRATADGEGNGDTPATKAELKAYGDADALRELARTNGVKVKDDDTK